MFSLMSAQQTLEQTVALPTIWDAVTLMWRRHCNVLEAGISLPVEYYLNQIFGRVNVSAWYVRPFSLHDTDITMSWHVDLKHDTQGSALKS